MAALAVFAALLAAGMLYQQIGTSRDRRRLRPQGQMIRAGAHRLHVTCDGRGSPVVLLESGIAASSLSWAHVQPQIAAVTRACAYDRAGLGWSDAPGRPMNFAQIVDDLSAVLEAVAPGERVVLAGHSFGSFIVRATAARHPALVAGLVLIDPAVEWLTTTPERARLLWGARQLSRVGALLARLGVVRACLALLTGGAPGAPRRFVRVFGPTTARTLERLVGEVRKLPPGVHPLVQAVWCQPKCFHAMADHLLALAQGGASIASAAPPPEIPVVVISSGDQPPALLAAHRALADASIGGRHVIASQSAHWVQFDEPELIVRVVRELVAASRSPDLRAP